MAAMRGGTVDGRRACWSTPSVSVIVSVSVSVSVNVNVSVSVNVRRACRSAPWVSTPMRMVSTGMTEIKSSANLPKASSYTLSGDRSNRWLQTSAPYGGWARCGAVPDAAVPCGACGGVRGVTGALVRAPSSQVVAGDGGVRLDAHARLAIVEWQEELEDLWHADDERR